MTDLADVARSLDQAAERGDFSGIALARRGGQPLFEHVAGLASHAHALPVRSDTRFAVASISKLPTAIAILRLVERGVVDLHAPLLEVLPAPWRTPAMTPAHTLHHLLSQTSGLPNYHDDADETWDSFAGAVARMADRGRRPQDVLPLLADLPARRPPGTSYEYSDTNFVLAGLVIEAVTGREWSEVVAEEVFRPAGMADTAVEALDDDPVRLATGYLTASGPVGYRRSNVLSVTARGMPDGGMLTTAADLAILVDALLDGRLVGPALLGEMLRPHGPHADPTEAYGYGCLLGIADGRVTLFGHGGSDPGVSAVLAHHLDAGLTIVVLCNQDRGSWAPSLALAEALGAHDPRG